MRQLLAGERKPGAGIEAALRGRRDDRAASAYLGVTFNTLAPYAQ